MSIRNELFQSASSLLKVAVGAFGNHCEPTFAELDDIGAVVQIAAERIETWLDALADEDGDCVFNALDACTAVCALIKSGLDPRNGKTISPLVGTLRLAVDRLDFFLADQSEERPRQRAAVEAIAACTGLTSA